MSRRGGLVYRFDGAGLLVAVAVAVLGCGGLASSRHGVPDEGIALPDAGVALQLPPAPPDPASTTPDAGLGSREPVDSLCGADGVLHSSAQVQTQQQADALAGCTRVAGDLSLHHRGVDLSPLGSLRVIEGQLWVDGEDAPRRGTSREGLDGFRSLEQVGGLVLLRASLTDLKPLARLRRVGLDPLEPREFEPTDPGVFEIRDCDGFDSLNGLDSLEQVTKLELASNSDLRSLTGMPRLAQLVQLKVVRCPLVDLGGVGPAVQDLTLTSTALTQLTGLGDARQLSRLELRGNLELTSLAGGTFPAQMSSVSSTKDGLVSLKGLENLNTVEELTLSAPNLATLQTLEGLEGLVQVGSFQLEGQKRLTSLAALGSLQRVQQFSIVGADALPNLVGLSNLREVDTFSLYAAALTELRGLGSLKVSYMDLGVLAVTSLAGLEQVTPSTLSLNQIPRLTTLDGLGALGSTTSLYIYEAPLLTDLRALSGLTELGSLSLGNTAVPNLDALSGLVKLGSLNLQGNSQLSQLDGVSAVSGLGSLTLYDNAALRTLPRFENVTGTDCQPCFGLFTLGIVDNPLLQSGPSLPALEQAESFQVSSNAALTTLGDWSALLSVGTLAVEDNPSLVSVQLPALASAREIYIRHNPTLDDTPFARLRQIRAERVKIVSNRSGPARLSPCPWVGDGQCDEVSNDCAPGSDGSDCRYF